MNRFTTQPRRMTGAKYLISIGIFCVILFWFLGGLSSISKTTSEQELESLKQAVIRSSVQCYALEGFYRKVWNIWKITMDLLMTMINMWFPMR